MANTAVLRRIVEPYVRKILAGEYGVPFHAASHPSGLATGGRHRFDAVSQDGRIVAAIKTCGLNFRGKGEAGKRRAVMEDLYLLRLVAASVRLMVLTDQAFYAFMTKELGGKLVPEIVLKYVQLPGDMQEEVRRVQKVASEEVTPA